MYHIMISNEEEVAQAYEIFLDKWWATYNLVPPKFQSQYKYLVMWQSSVIYTSSYIQSDSILLELIPLEIITKCKWGDCPVKELCSRYTVKSRWRQAFIKKMRYNLDSWCLDFINNTDKEVC